MLAKTSKGPFLLPCVFQKHLLITYASLITNICHSQKMSSSTWHETSPSESLMISLMAWSDYSKTALRLEGQIFNPNHDKTIRTFSEGHLQGWPTEDINMNGLWCSSLVYPLQPLVQLGQLSPSGGLIRALAQLFAHLQQEEKVCTHKGTCISWRKLVIFFYAWSSRL